MKACALPFAKAVAPSVPASSLPSSNKKKLCAAVPCGTAGYFDGIPQWTVNIFG
jgi:hypothetical protein